MVLDRTGERITARTVGLGVRAPRVAVLISHTLNWSGCLALVETLSGVWGGGTYAVIPTSGRFITPLFWSLLKRYDPDWFAVFANTVDISPELVAQLHEFHGTASPPDRDAFRSPLHLWPDNAPYPLTTAAQAYAQGGPQVTVRSYRLRESPIAQLFVAATAGSFSPKRRAELSQQGMKFEDIELDVLAVTPHRVARDVWGRRDLPPGTRLPFDLAQHNIGSYSMEEPFRDSDQLVFVCGATIEDFAYFWTLRSISGFPQQPKVFWLPHIDPASPGADDAVLALSKARAVALRDLSGRLGDLAFALTSVSDTVGDLPERVDMRLLQSTISIATSRFDPPAWIVPFQLEQLAPDQMRFWDTENPPSAHSSIVQFLDGEATAFLDTPTPQGLRITMEAHVNWMVDVVIEHVALPSRPKLAAVLIAPRGLTDVRVSQDGLSYHALHHFQAAGMASKNRMVHPRLRLPSDRDVLHALMAGHGLLATPSDKGRFESEFIRLCRGLENAAFLFCEPSHRRLLERLEPSLRGSVRKRNGQPWLTTLAELITDFASEQAAVDAVDRLLGWGLLQRGFRIKCPTCLLTDFYAQRELDQAVVCHRCSRRHVYAADAPVVFRLDPVAQLALVNNSHLPLLALDRLRMSAKRGFHFISGTDVRRTDRETLGDNPWLEIDFLASIDGRLILGECKSSVPLTPSDRAQLNKYSELCTKIRPDELQVSTGAPRWETTDEACLDRLAKKVGPNGVSLTRQIGTDLGW